MPNNKQAVIALLACIFLCSFFAYLDFRKNSFVWTDFSIKEIWPDKYIIQLTDKSGQQHTYRSSHGLFWYNEKGVGVDTKTELQFHSFVKRLEFEHKTLIEEKRIDEDYFK